MENRLIPDTYYRVKGFNNVLILNAILKAGKPVRSGHIQRHLEHVDGVNLSKQKISALIRNRLPVYVKSHYEVEKTRRYLVFEAKSELIQLVSRIHRR